MVASRKRYAFKALSDLKAQLGADLQIVIDMSKVSTLRISASWTCGCVARGKSFDELILASCELHADVGNGTAPPPALRALEGNESPSALVVDSRPGVKIVRTQGEFDFTCAPQFEQIVLETTVEPWEILIVDLTQARYIDSTILTALIRVKKVKKDKLRLVAAVTGNVRNMLRITGLTASLRVEETVEAALQG